MKMMAGVSRWRPALLAAMLALLPGLDSALAQSPSDLTLAQTGSMPRWTVPVLRLVSATHVEPTTGVVLSDGGMVLVPSEFAGPGDEIVVLDGGTDIIRYGRPATLLRRFSAEGLQVLSVPTLSRRGAAVSSAPLTDGDTVRLSAFPPAELIARGEPPLDIEVRIAVPVENGQPRISGETPLPNVTGPLVDRCGNLAGFSSASGVQSMSTDAFPRYQWKQKLLELAAEMQFEIPAVECRPTAEQPAAAAEPSPAMEPDTLPGPEPEPASENEPEEILQESEPQPADPEEPQADEMAQDETGAAEEPATEETDITEILPPVELDGADSANAETGLTPDKEPRPAHWLWLVAAAVLLTAAGLVHRRRIGRLSSDDEGPLDDLPTVNQAKVEQSPEETPAPGQLADSELLVRGQLTDGTPIEIRVPVHRKAINLVIGRGAVDISIDSPAISRRHAELNGTADALTLSDLGSSNGTTINGIPCLEGETMYVRPGDTIIVGNARFHYAIMPA